MKKFRHFTGRLKNFKPKSAQRIGLFDVYKSSWAIFRANLRKFITIAAVVLVTSSTVRSYDASASQNSDIALILYIASLFTFAALAWMNFNLEESRKLRFDKIYVVSSARFLPLLLVSIVQIAIAALSVVGVFVFLLAVAAGLGWWLAVVGVALIGLSAWLLVKYSFAGVIAVGEGLSGIQALKTSSRLAKKHFWRLSGAYLSFLLIVGFVCGLILELFIRIPNISKMWFFEGLVNGILLSLVIPLMTVFVCNLYRALNNGKSSS